ncbi:hypothetical protein M093_1763 [Bacteroides uniformis str. 3978 T3 i]|nr:hypothetical protein M093_1763 [Bacteroides uniformis str. 3978 T3 i]
MEEQILSLLLKKLKWIHRKTSLSALEARTSHSTYNGYGGG